MPARNLPALCRVLASRRVAWAVSVTTAAEVYEYSAVILLVYSSSICTSTGTLSGPLLARCRRSCCRLVLASIEVLCWLPSKFRSKVPQTLFPATSRHLASSFSAACQSQHSGYTGLQEPAVLITYFTKRFRDCRWSIVSCWLLIASSAIIERFLFTAHYE